MNTTNEVQVATLHCVDAIGDLKEEIRNLEAFRLSVSDLMIELNEILEDADLITDPIAQRYIRDMEKRIRMINLSIRPLCKNISDATDILVNESEAAFSKK